MHAHRHQPDRDHQPRGQYPFRDVAAGQLPGPGAPARLQAGDRQRATSRRARRSTLDFAMEPAPVQLDEIVSTATGEQRKLEVANAVSTIDAAKVAEEAPITEFGNLLSGPRGGRAGPQERRHHRHRHPHPDPRLQQHLPLQRAALLHRRHPDGEQRQPRSTLDIGGFGRASGAAPVADQRPQSRRHRVHRDREGPGGRHAVRHPGLATASSGSPPSEGPRGPPRWNLFTEVGAVHDDNTYPLNFFGRDTTAGDRSGLGRLLHHADAELDGLCTQTSVQQYSPTRRPGPPARSRPACASSTAPTSPAATTRSPTTVGGDYENEDGVFRLPQFEEDSVRTLLGTVPGNQIRPNALERVERPRQSGRQRRPRTPTSRPTSGIPPATPGSSRTTTASSPSPAAPRPATNPPDFMIGAGTSPRRSSSPSWPTRRSSASPAGSPATGGRPSWLTTRATLGYDVVNRQDVQFFPTGQVAPRWIRTTTASAPTTGSRSPRPRSTWPPPRDSGSRPTIGSKTSVGGQFFRDFSSRQPRDRARPAGRAPRRITGAATIEAQGHDRRVPLHRHLHRGGDQAQGAPLRDRRPALRRQQRVRQELRRHRLPEGQRVLAPVRRAVLPLRVPQHPPASRGARRLGPAAGHHRRAALLHAGRGQEGRRPTASASPSAAWATPTSSRSGPASSSWASTPACSTTASRSSSPTTTSSPRTRWSSGTSRRRWALRVPVLQPRPDQEPRASSWRSTPGSSTARLRLGPAR